MLRQTVGIPKGTNCTPLIADFFLNFYESQCMAKIQKDHSKHSLVRFILRIMYIYDILIVNNPNSRKATMQHQQLTL